MAAGRRRHAVRGCRCRPRRRPVWGRGGCPRGCGIRVLCHDGPGSIAALGRLHGLGDQLRPEQLSRLTEPYSPFRMWVCFLLRVAVNRGLIEGVAGKEMALRRQHRPQKG